MDITRDMMGYKTFVEYRKKRLDFSRIRAFQLYSISGNLGERVNNC